LLRALLDANILISAVVRPSGPPGEIVLGLLSWNAFELVLSPRIVAEVERALSQNKIRKYLRDSREALLWLSDIVAVADVVEDAGRVLGVCRDSADDMVLGAALEGRADVIVTGDRDLLALDVHEGIAIVAPRGFLDLLKR
jgi:putative PIN family toxin of toxin-antitoxin system